MMDDEQKCGPSNEAIYDLQERFTYAEDTIATLNDVVSRQDQELRGLQRRVELLEQRLRSASELLQGVLQDRGGDERPPHY